MTDTRTGRFLSAGGGSVGSGGVRLRVIQPNMVEEGGKFIGAQGHHLLSQVDGIYEWEVDVLIVWGGDAVDEVPRVLFLGICLNFYYFSGLLMAPQL
ncbi:hypothetical protein [Corynebacterium pseudodiphtheriticum]|uniref:hypothetical protein n=1 Tax=Corynebacterium pseudodiphtheriticum TaxID=37637 RepID=UPI002540B351|nr:hypothetical protein [Corynebacterium pseudodiphtheriticum]MDK4273754.1 hypothetical protein [Corynebacterium pseudodiphtheriticum]